MSIEGIRLKIKKYLIKLLRNRRQQELNKKEFTIISNNCWGGMVYESFNLPKQSPTVGLFFMADEYIKFLSKFPDILNSDIVFIKPEDSKYVEFLKKDKRFGKYPIGIIDDVEIAFLHYHSEKEALTKWKRRCERINLDKLLVKMNDQNECNEQHLEKFLDMPFKNKIFFAARDFSSDSSIYIKCANNGSKSIYASQEPVIFKTHFDVIKQINEL